MWFVMGIGGGGADDQRPMHVSQTTKFEIFQTWQNEGPKWWNTEIPQFPRSGSFPPMHLSFASSSSQTIPSIMMIISYVVVCPVGTCCRSNTWLKVSVALNESIPFSLVSSSCCSSRGSSRLAGGDRRHPVRPSLPPWSNTRCLSCHRFEQSLSRCHRHIIIMCCIIWSG